MPTPNVPGLYGVKIDLVAEGISWFETSGTTPAVHTISVTGQSSKSK
jgi:hypothetical protein